MTVHASSDELSSEILAAAARPLSHEPRPFLRWAGSKRALLAQIVDVLPRKWNVYREPFLGSGALFFLIQPKRAVLSDTCEELIDAFGAIRDGHQTIIRYMRDWKPDRDLYYAMRENRSSGRYKRTAQFLYLNKTCWNGLYRVNSSGKFNVPYGRPKTNFLVDESNLRSCANALRPKGIELRLESFEKALERARPGDLVFLDPPYVTQHNNNGFIDYNESLFSWQDQVLLAEHARNLADHGVNVVATNAFHNEVIDLYDSFNVRPLLRTSTLAADSRHRAPIREALLWRLADG